MTFTIICVYIRKQNKIMQKVIFGGKKAVSKMPPQVNTTGKGNIVPLKPVNRKNILTHRTGHK